MTTVAEDWVDQVFAAIESHALQTGWFDRVNTHEYKGSPGAGLSCAIWVQNVRAVGKVSGLKSSSALLTFFVRVYGSMTEEPMDEIDPNMLKAVSSFMRKIHGNFDFGLHPLVRNVDLLGELGEPLSARAGYLNISGKFMRVMTITLPVICNDVWAQEGST